MWKLLYDSLKEIKVIDFQDITQANTKRFIEENGGIGQDFKEMLIHLFGIQDLHDKNEIRNIYVIFENERLAGILYGHHVLNLKMKPFYKKLIQKATTIKYTDEISISIVHKVVKRIIEQKNSIISPKEFEILNGFSNTENDMPFMENMYCIDSSGFSDLRLYHLCETRYFKRIKNGYSKKWNTVVAMKDFRVTKLYYKKHLLMGFSLYRKEDGEQFFWSGQLQEVLESLTLK
ncbi:hypothetical protein [Maribacter thermophilus]|uniref:hypothetical protein n=1 Tax=Maribacter thermophilus TaxID=1197874 RepID=UPI000AE356BC|nr:hypothetical protein [Maribacter thermophilus]